MSKPDWADEVGAWVDPDDWELTEESFPHPFVLRWFGQSQDCSGTWVVDVVSLSYLGGPATLFSSWSRELTCASFKSQHQNLSCRGKHGETIADLFRRIDAARRIGVDG